MKVDGAYRRPPRRSDSQDPDEQRIAEGVLTCEPAGDALVVLHTPPGEANRVAVALDRLAWPDIVGTIAGDDTIFLAVKDGTAQRGVLRAVRKLISPERGCSERTNAKGRLLRAAPSMRSRSPD